MQKKADCPADNLEVPSFASLITASSISVPHSEYQPEEEPDDTPHFPNQKEIDDLIKDLGLGKSKAELLTSRLKEWKIVDKSVKITAQRKRDEAYSRFYTYDEAVCYCKDIPGKSINVINAFLPEIWLLYKVSVKKKKNKTI